MTKFDTIRPYQDSEVIEIIAKYKESSVFKKLINHIYPTWSEEILPLKLNKINTTQGFQELFIYPAVKAAIDRSMDHFTISGLNNLKRDQNYLFISNHRDIVLDSTLMFYVLYQNEYKTGETAIGNNLLSTDLVTDIVKLNQNFIVHRNLPTREMIVKSKELSKYIRYVLTDKERSIWISHREGRTKDGNDKTNPGVLKMIAMDCEENKIKYLLDLNIVPVSISYEFDSCDHLKASELTDIELHGKHEKDGTEDMKSIITGITQQKGRVHLAFGKPIEPNDINFTSDRIQDHFKQLSDYIDQQIHQNFKLFPGNFIAQDLLNDGSQFSEKYNAWEKTKFLSHINTILNSRVDKDGYEIFNKILLKIYANPVSNQLEKINL